MAAPLVSVVLPVHNGERFLAEALDSIRTQTLAEWELLAIDDRSTDGTARILADYARRDPRIRAVSGRRPGLVEALNEGIALSRGGYVARLDADDAALPMRLEHQVEFLKSSPEVAVVGGSAVCVDEAGTTRWIDRYRQTPKEVHEGLARGSTILHPAVLMRRDALVSAGGYRAPFRHAEDYELWLRLAEHHLLANLAEPVLRYRIHAGQVSMVTVDEQAISVLAARHAAAQRRAGRPDPFADRDRPLDLRALRGLVDPADVRAERRRLYAYYATIAAKVDDRATEDLLLREALRIAGSDRTALAGVLAGVARQRRREGRASQGRLVAALGTVAGACPNRLAPALRASARLATTRSSAAATLARLDAAIAWWIRGSVGVRDAATTPTGRALRRAATFYALHRARRRPAVFEACSPGGCRSFPRHTLERDWRELRRAHAFGRLSVGLAGRLVLDVGGGKGYFGALALDEGAAGVVSLERDPESRTWLESCARRFREVWGADWEVLPEGEDGAGLVARLGSAPLAATTARVRLDALPDLDDAVVDLLAGVSELILELSPGMGDHHELVQRWAGRHGETAERRAVEGADVLVLRGRPSV